MTSELDKKLRFCIEPSARREEILFEEDSPLLNFANIRDHDSRTLDAIARLLDEPGRFQFVFHDGEWLLCDFKAGTSLVVPEVE